MASLKDDFDKEIIDYDAIYESMVGWFAYAKQANTYNLRKSMGQKLEASFPNDFSSTELRKIAKITPLKIHSAAEA